MCVCTPEKTAPFCTHCVPAKVPVPTAADKPKRTVDQVVLELREAVRAYRRAAQLVDDTERELAGLKAHLVNVAKYRSNLRLELETVVEGGL